MWKQWKCKRIVPLKNVSFNRSCRREGEREKGKLDENSSSPVSHGKLDDLLIHTTRETQSAVDLV